jgi:uncharacterized membrane protein
MKMSKQKVLLVLNPVMALVLLALAITAMLHVQIPYNIYRILHPGLGYTFLTGVVLHVILNWSWIRTMLLKRK